MITPVLETNNFVVRAFERRDLGKFVEYRSQRIVARYQNWESYTSHDANDLFESMDYSGIDKLKFRVQSSEDFTLWSQATALLHSANALTLRSR